MRNLLLIVALSFVLCSPPQSCQPCLSCEDTRDQLAVILDALDDEKHAAEELRTENRNIKSALEIYSAFKHRHDDEFLIWDTKRKIDSLQTILNEKR